MLISFAVSDRLKGDALQDKMKLIGGKLHTISIQVKSRYLKSAFLQAPVEDGEAALLVNEHFQVGTRLVDEDKGIALRYLSPQFIEDDAAE